MEEVDIYEEFNVNIKQKPKINWLFILLVLASILLGYLIFGWTNKDTSSTKYNRTIDSLTQEIIKLDSLHVKQDSFIVIYKDSVMYKDSLIEVEKIKFNDIKKKYNEARTNISKYSNSQLDSFFSNRYRY